MMCSMLRASGQKKSLLVVAVSSPYDFAMDKTIGTYICTFDFTETAMHALVRGLFGEFTPHGTLPGTLRKSKKVLKSRQQWLVENYSRDRDSRGLNDLIRAIARASAPQLPFLQSTTAALFELFNPNIEESHFVVRNKQHQGPVWLLRNLLHQGRRHHRRHLRRPDQAQRVHRAVAPPAGTAHSDADAGRQEDPAWRLVSGRLSRHTGRRHD